MKPEQKNRDRDFERKKYVVVARTVDVLARVWFPIVFTLATIVACTLSSIVAQVHSLLMDFALIQLFKVVVVFLVVLAAIVAMTFVGIRAYYTMKKAIVTNEVDLPIFNEN